MTRRGEFTPAVVARIWERDGGCCALCGREVVKERRGEAVGGWSMQHRKARGAGGTRRRMTPADGVILHGSGVTECHGEVESRREWAREYGFAVSTIGIAQSAEVPIMHAVHGWVLLDEDGGFEPWSGDVGEL